MNFDLEKMDMKELRALKKAVDHAIETFAEKQKNAALEALNKAAALHGFKLSDLVIIPNARPPVTAKYANPADTSQTWTGRGRKPRWVQEQLDAGKTIEELAI